MNPVETYLKELRDIRASGGVPETSGYGALANLLSEVGGKLKPKVRCTINPRNAGAGIPDGGFFTASQFEKGKGEPLPGQLPARGALEVKPVGDDASQVAASVQVRRYLEKYRQVLVTTYREFVLVGFDADGRATSLESFSLGASEAEFWALAAHPGSDAAQALGERLTDFLRRVLLRQAQIAAPQDLAWFLASYAREARARAEERDLPALAFTRKGLEESLGMSFSGEKGDHFFRSTLVQTLFYGLFAAWVFWAEHHPPADAQARFRWREAAGYLHIPILQKLFYDFANPTQLGALKLDEVLDWAAEALNRVDRAAFFATLRAEPRRAVLLRALPRGVRPAAAQGARRLVHAPGDRAVHGGPCRHRAARGARHRRRPRRPARRRARPLLRHRRLPGRGAEQDRRDAAREGRRRARRQRLEAGRHEPRLRLRDPAGAVRDQPPADRHAAAPPGRALRR